MKIFGATLVALSALLLPALASDCTVSTAATTSTDSTSSVGDESDSTSSIAAEADTTVTEASTTTSEVDSSSASEDSGVSLSVVTPVIDCADLASVNLTSIGGEGSNITSVTQTTSDDIACCIVEGTFPPAISWEVMLPVDTWTQRYMQTGCGGLCGMISLSVAASYGADAVDNGNFVLATTDMDGGTSGVFGLEEDKRVAFAYEAHHWTAEAAKLFIKTYYGQEQQYAYFSGCSDGGREAVMEALRYPNDFNGIIAGAPAMLFTFQNSFHHGWLAVSNVDDNGDHIVLSDRLEILHEAVVSACDSLDGIDDGLLSDPRICNFDVTSIQCSDDADNSTCLTSTEVKVVEKFYAGPIDADSGDHLTVGEVQFSSELGWSGVFVPETATTATQSENVALACIEYLILDEYPGANYTLDDFVFANSTIDFLRPRHPLLDSVSADLSEFEAAGGKLILWHGWADPQISPHTTIAYHEALQSHMGDDVVANFERLYLLPGVYHCGSGEGPSEIDLVTPIMQWVEDGIAPDAILTSSATDDYSNDAGQWDTSSGRRLESTSGSESTAVTRPVYPYPYVAKYIGSGSVNDSANFEKGDPLYTNLTGYWLGQDFFNPYTPIEG